MLRFRSLPLLAVLLVGAAPASAGGGCAPSKCVPRTGNWTAPSPQKLTSPIPPYQPATMRMTVAYRRAGKVVKSTYGNRVESFAVYLRYFCADEHAPWVESGFSIGAPIAIKRNGTVKVELPNYDDRAHKLSLRFKRETFTGRLSGTATNSNGDVCSTSLSFSGRFKP